MRGRARPGEGGSRSQCVGGPVFPLLADDKRRAAGGGGGCLPSAAEDAAAAQSVAAVLFCSASHRTAPPSPAAQFSCQLDGVAARRRASRAELYFLRCGERSCCGVVVLAVQCSSVESFLVSAVTSSWCRAVQHRLDRCHSSNGCLCVSRVCFKVGSIESVFLLS